MKLITCDFCGKKIDNDDLNEEYGWYEDSYYDLCDECDENYHRISEDMRNYRENARRQIELEIEEKTKKRIEELRKEIKIEKNICERCGTTKNVSYVVDPYDEEIHNTTRWCWLCDSCYQEYCDDI